MGTEYAVTTSRMTATATRWSRGLRALGHQVDIAGQSSGLSAIVRDTSGWVGGADPRREGAVTTGPS